MNVLNITTHVSLWQPQNARKNAIALVQIWHPSRDFAVKLATPLTASGASFVKAHKVESEFVRETFSNDPQCTRIERFVLPAQLAANARKLLEVKYLWDAIGARLLRVYKRVLEGRHGP